MSRLLGTLLFISSLAGCAQPSPAPASAQLIPRFDDLSLDQALAWFEERTLECIGPEMPFSDPRDWQCTHEFDAGSTIEVRITADRDGVSQLVGLASGLNAEDSASFLGTTVAVIAVPLQEREALTAWATRRAVQGGKEVFDGVSVELQPQSARRAVIVLPVP